jgi:hypothetical protein
MQSTYSMASGASCLALEAAHGKGFVADSVTACATDDLCSLLRAALSKFVGRHAFHNYTVIARCYVGCLCHIKQITTSYGTLQWPVVVQSCSRRPSATSHQMQSCFLEHSVSLHATFLCFCAMHDKQQHPVQLCMGEQAAGVAQERMDMARVVEVKLHDSDGKRVVWQYMQAPELPRMQRVKQHCSRTHRRQGVLRLSMVQQQQQQLNSVHWNLSLHHQMQQTAQASRQANRKRSLQG